MPMMTNASASNMFPNIHRPATTWQNANNVIIPLQISTSSSKPFALIHKSSNKISNTKACVCFYLTTSYSLIGLNFQLGTILRLNVVQCQFCRNQHPIFSTQFKNGPAAILYSTMNPQKLCQPQRPSSPFVSLFFSCSSAHSCSFV